MTRSISLRRPGKKVGDRSRFDDVGNAIREMSYRGINGHYKIDPETNSGISYPNMTDDPEGGQAHLFFQVQDNEHTIVPRLNLRRRRSGWR